MRLIVHVELAFNLDHHDASLALARQNDREAEQKDTIVPEHAIVSLSQDEPQNVSSPKKLSDSEAKIDTQLERLSSAAQRAVEDEGYDTPDEDADVGAAVWVDRTYGAGDADEEETADVDDEQFGDEDNMGTHLPSQQPGQQMHGQGTSETEQSFMLQEETLESGDTEAAETETGDQADKDEEKEKDVGKGKQLRRGGKPPRIKRSANVIVIGARRPEVERELSQTQAMSHAKISTLSTDPAYALDAQQAPAGHLCGSASNDRGNRQRWFKCSINTRSSACAGTTRYRQ